MADGGANWNGGAADHVNIEIDIAAIANALVKDRSFIDAVTKAVRNQLLRDARQMGTLFRQWGGTR